MAKRKKHGGARKGSGRPRKYANPVTATFKVEKKNLDGAKKKHGKNLNAAVNAFLEQESNPPAQP